MMFAVMLLAVHPEVQEELYKEVKSVCGDRLPSFSDLPNLIYGLCVMYETMRLYPIIGSLAVTVSTNRDETLLGKYLIPKDTSLGLDMYNLHRNEKYWGPTANEYNPSRFDNRLDESEGWYSMDGKTKWPVRGAWFGFSEGPRACLGNYL